MTVPHESRALPGPVVRHQQRSRGLTRALANSRGHWSRDLCAGPEEQKEIRILRIFLIERIVPLGVTAPFATSPDDQSLWTASGSFWRWNSTGVPFTKCSSRLVAFGGLGARGAIRENPLDRKIRILFALPARQGSFMK